MKQKIIKIGNSQGIILSKDILASAGLKPEGEVYITPDPSTNALIISEKIEAVSYSKNTKVSKIISEIDEKYKEAWKKLANE